MPAPWTDRLPPLPGDLTTLREVAASDVHTLFTLFSASGGDGVHGSSAPDARQVRGICRVVTAGARARPRHLLRDRSSWRDGGDRDPQVRSLDSTSSDAESGFVLSAHFWSTGVFADAANALMEFVFTTPARDTSRSAHRSAQPARTGCHAETRCAAPNPCSRRRHRRVFHAIQRPCGPCGNMTGGTGHIIPDSRPRTRGNGSAQRSKRRKGNCGGAKCRRQSNRIRCSCSTAADGSDGASGQRRVFEWLVGAFVSGYGERSGATMIERLQGLALSVQRKRMRLTAT